MNDILPEASEARKQTIEQMLKQLDKYVVDAINSSETQREFDFSELLTADSLAINNLDKIKQHFENKNIKLRSFMAMTMLLIWGMGGSTHLNHSFMGQKRIGTKPRESSLNGELAKK